MNNKLYQSSVYKAPDPDVLMAALKAPPGLTLSADQSKIPVQLSQLAADQARAKLLLTKLMERFVVTSESKVRTNQVD